MGTAMERKTNEWLVPGHCTGWKATHEIARRFPEAYVQTSVGTQLRFA
jgi:7,8-dihydropterin-6-yl-methyl-4-(beta-D-ribofuranosyl)aminobenzene 5'-phosphate synthase